MKGWTLQQAVLNRRSIFFDFREHKLLCDRGAPAQARIVARDYRRSRLPSFVCCEVARVHRKSAASHVQVGQYGYSRGFSITRLEGSDWRLGVRGPLWRKYGNAGRSCWAMKGAR